MRVGQKRKTPVSKFFRISAYLLVMAIVLVGIYMVIAKATRPYRIGYIESKDISDIKKQIEQAKAENKALKDDIEYLKRPEGKTVEAENMFCKEGEVAVVIEQPDRAQFELEHMKNPPVEETFFQVWKRKISEFFSRF